MIMQKHLHLFTTLTLFATGLSLASTPFLSATQGQQAPSLTEDLRSLPLKEMTTDFRQVAKKAVPAVVSIKVVTKKKSAALSEDGQDPYDIFGNGGSGSDLWGFFNIPRRSESSRSQQMAGQASGVIVSPDGYILTNSHVVNDMDSINVLLNDGREFPAKVLGDDPNSDLALIKINADHLPYLPLGNSDDLEVGQQVAAIGNPFGLQATLTTGVVSAKSRNNLDIVPYADFIQTDAAINRGNSGGPLITLNGEVIGINTAIATNSSSGYMGIGFAIPSNMAKHVMDEILTDGKVSHGFLGVSLQTIDYNLAQAFGLKKVEGALVANVVKDTPAEKAGLQVEDIIVGMNGRPVENSAALRNSVYMTKPGAKMTLTVLRKNQQIQVPITVGSHEESVAAAKVAPANHKSQLGLEVDNLTPEIARSLGYTEEQGVVVTNVKANSVAAMTGLKKGALILSVNRKKINNVTEYKQALADSPKDRPVLLQIRQGDVYLFLSMQAE